MVVVGVRRVRQDGGEAKLGVDRARASERLGAGQGQTLLASSPLSSPLSPSPPRLSPLQLSIDRRLSGATGSSDWTSPPTTTPSAVAEGDNCARYVCRCLACHLPPSFLPSLE